MLQSVAVFTQLKITCRQRTISGQIFKSSQTLHSAQTKMSTRKRLVSLSSSSVSSCKTSSFCVHRTKVDQRERQGNADDDLDKVQNDPGHVASLSCSAYQEFDDRLRGMKNCSSAFVTGATNLRSSNFKDNVKMEMQCHCIARRPLRVLVKSQLLKPFQGWTVPFSKKW